MKRFVILMALVFCLSLPSPSSEAAMPPSRPRRRATGANRTSQSRAWSRRSRKCRRRGRRQGPPRRRAHRLPLPHRQSPRIKKRRCQFHLSPKRAGPYFTLFSFRRLGIPLLGKQKKGPSHRGAMAPSNENAYLRCYLPITYR
jgi:hypothetical protein